MWSFVHLLLLSSLLLVASACREPTGVVPQPLPAPETPSQLSTNSSVPVSAEFRFQSVAAEAGIDFVHCSGDGPEKPFPAANGNGVGVIDYDRDGWQDLLFLTSNAFTPPLTQHANVCYRNTGNWQFQNVTNPTGLGFSGYSAGIAVGDYNSDGFPDVYVTCYGENQLFENCGDGTFENISQAAGVADSKWATSAAFLDMDDDGFLDLYVGNYAQWTMESNVFCGDNERKIRMHCSPKSVPPEVDLLYHNTSTGTFADVSESAGIRAISGRSQGVLAADLTNDGRTDLYVSNDLNPNALFVNQGGGVFVEMADQLGVAYSHTGASQAGMGIGCSDANRDGRLDLFVTNFEGEHNAFYLQDEAGFFSEVSHLRGLAAASLPWIGWGTTLTDFNLDGWPDALVINGHTDHNMQELGREGNYRQPALLWQNVQGNFALVQPQDSPYFQQVHPARGLATADLDNDGDWDVICCHQDQPPELLRNDSPRGPNSVIVELQLVGVASNRDAIGATVRVRGEETEYALPIVNSGSYLSASDSRLILALPPNRPSPCEIEVQWGPNEVSEVTVPIQSISGVIRQDRFYAR